MSRSSSRRQGHKRPSPSDRREIDPMDHWYHDDERPVPGCAYCEALEGEYAPGERDEEREGDDDLRSGD